MASFGILSSPEHFSNLASGVDNHPATADILLGFVGEVSEPTSYSDAHYRTELNRCHVISLTTRRVKPNRLDVVGQKMLRKVKRLELHQPNVLGRSGGLLSWISDFDDELLPW